MPSEDRALQYLPFIVDCVVALTHNTENGYSRRCLRIVRVPSFELFCKRYSISHCVPADWRWPPPPHSSNLLIPPTDRVSTGIHALDEMLYGGLFRGSTTR